MYIVNNSITIAPAEKTVHKKGATELCIAIKT